MATPDIYGQLPPELLGDQRALERQNRIAEALMQNGAAPMSGRMVGRFYVPPSPVEGIANLANSYAGMKMGKDVDQGYAALGKRYGDMQAEEIARITGMRNGSNPRPSATDPQEAQQSADQGTPMPGPIQDVAPNPREALVAAITSKFPAVRQLGALDFQGDLKREEGQAQRDSRLHERILALDAAAQNAALSREERAARQAEAAQLRRELQAQNQAFQAAQNQANRELRTQIAGHANKPPTGFRFTPNGDLERIPGGPADLKAEAEAAKKASGSEDVSVSLATLRDAYDRLEKGGGITSTKKSGMENIGSALSSSAVGQAAGKLTGSQNQSARNDIAMSRPALLAALMKATGMSAKQMDSNAELKLWLSTATDPTLDVESNRRALDNIEKRYLGGGQGAPKPAAGASGAWKDL